jgi:plasmid stabilization system protein ParE
VKHTIRPTARDDIIREFRYYLVDQDRPEVAKRFVEAVEKNYRQDPAHAARWRTETSFQRIARRPALVAGGGV